MNEYSETSINKQVLFKRDLKNAPNLKYTFDLINQHLYGKLKRTDTDTRARSKEIINLLLCKLRDEISKKPNDLVEFCIKKGENAESVANRIRAFFKNEVKRIYPQLIGENEQITLNEELIYLIVKELQNYSLIESSKDVFRDAFEIFVSKILKDERGQFFTPVNVINFMVKYIRPELDSKVLDPACGHGGFLLEVKDYLWDKVEENPMMRNNKVESKKKIISNLYGIDKDLFLARISKLYLEILSGGESKIFCEDSLDPSNYYPETNKYIRDDHFDYILTNPPFGVKIPIDNKNVLKKYELAHSWANKNDKWIMRNNLTKKQPPQILFIERCIQLVKEGGKLGIILPEGLFGNPTDRYIWQFLKQKGKILGIISLDKNTFQPYTCNKASILFFQKLNSPPKDYIIDFAIVNNIGHDKDGKILYQLNNDGSIKTDSSEEPIINDDLIELEQKLRNAESFDFMDSKDIFKMKLSQIKNDIFIPNYYLSVEKTLNKLAIDDDFILMSINDLMKNKIIYTKNNGHLPRGDEIGSAVYGLGAVPFIRTSDFFNWELNLNSKKKTSEEVYFIYKDKQNIEFGDILLVKDGGPNYIGNTAFITPLDTKIIIQSHIYQLKVLENEISMDPYLLLYLLNLDVVQKQIQAITFVQGTIATIGDRIKEVMLPLPATLEKRKNISNHIKEIIEEKTKLRKKIMKISIDQEF